MKYGQIIAHKKKHSFLNSNITLIISAIVLALLSFIYYFSIGSIDRTTQAIASVSNEIKATQALLNKVSQDKAAKEQQIQSLTSSINSIKENIEKLLHNKIDELILINVNNQIASTKETTEALKLRLSALAIDITDVKDKLQRAIGDQHQLEEQNEAYENKKYQNSLLRKSIEEMKANQKGFDAKSDLHSILQSNTIETYQEVKALSQWINGDKDVQLRLIYSGKLNGDLSEIFHKKVDSISPTVSIIHDTQGKKYGGYTEQTWNHNSGNDTNKSFFKEDRFAFLFSLSIMRKYPINNPSEALLIGKELLCAFGRGADLLIKERCVNCVAYNFAQFPNSYGDQSISRNEITNYNDYFDVEEIEVFQVFKS